MAACSWPASYTCFGSSGTLEQDYQAGRYLDRKETTYTILYSKLPKPCLRQSLYVDIAIYKDLSRLVVGQANHRDGMIERRN
jgi:hypothetical protein